MFWTSEIQFSKSHKERFFQDLARPIRKISHETSPFRHCHGKRSPFPRPSASPINEYLKPLDNSAYLENIRKNVKNIKATSDATGKQSLEELLLSSIDSDAFPPSDPVNVKTNEVLYYIFDSSHDGLAYIDLTGRFPYRSARGNEYILVGYHYDANAILATALKNRQAASITAAWKNLNKKFQHAGVIPSTVGDSPYYIKSGYMY